MKICQKRQFIEEMKKYMSENNLNDDKFLKNLCDDIYISYRTFGTKFGTMYNNARQTSQGTQRCYTVSHTPHDENEERSFRNPIRLNSLPIPRLTRQTNILQSQDINTINYFNNIHIDDIGVLEHEVSDFNDTPYLTPGATQLMREISLGVTRNDDTEEETEEEEEPQEN
jgi:AraC-like DNA-binding protein